MLKKRKGREMKKILFTAVMCILLISMYGCFALVAGGVAGTGTAVWLSEKLTQQFNASYEQTIKATEKALNSLKLEIKKQSKEENVAQFRSEYTDGKEIWIDIRKITDTSTKVEVRVGVVGSDKTAAEKILSRIKRYL